MYLKLVWQIRCALVHRRGAQGHIELQIVIVRPRLLQIRQRRRILRGALHPERLQRLARHHPRADRGRKRLGLERPERHIFPLLDIARAPVVQQDETEDHRFRLRLGEHLAHRRRLADHDAHFQLEIQPLAGAERRHLRARRFQLAAGPPHLGAGDHDGRGTAVIADRHVQPVRLQRIVLAAEHDADIGGMLLRRIEIGIAGDRDRQMQCYVCHRHQRALAQELVVAQLRMIVAKQFADARPGARPDLRPQRHEGVDRGLREHVEGGRQIDHPLGFQHRKIEHVIADRDPDPRGGRGGRREHAVRQVLDREVGGGIDWDEGAKRGIVGMGQIFRSCLNFGDTLSPSFRDVSARTQTSDPQLRTRDPRSGFIAARCPGMTEKAYHGLFGSKRFSSPFQQSA